MPHASPVSSFKEGAFAVGVHIRPGSYVSSGPKSGDSCYWERVSDFSGEFSAILDNEFTYSRSAVRIGTGDTGFISRGCGTWTRVGA